MNEPHKYIDVFFECFITATLARGMDVAALVGSLQIADLMRVSAHIRLNPVRTSRPDDIINLLVFRVQTEKALLFF